VIVLIKQILLVSVFAAEFKPNFSDLELWDFAEAKSTYRYRNPLQAAVQEWKDSAIDEDLIRLNLISLPVSYSVKEEKNSYPLLDLINVDYEIFLDANGHLPKFPLESSWTYPGYDPFTLKESSNYEIKVYPVLRTNLKYENSSKGFFFKLAKVSLKIANKIFPDEYPLDGLIDTSAEAKDFWLKVKNSNKAIFFTEGHKKALSLLSNGYIAIGLRGSCRPFSYKELENDFEVDLNEYIKEVLSWGERPIYIVYDTDENIALRSTIRIYTYNFAKFVKDLKNIDEVKIIDLPEGSAKGVDDYFVQYGSGNFSNLLQASLSPEEYKRKYNPIDLKRFFEIYPGNLDWCFRRCYGKKCLEEYIDVNGLFNREPSDPSTFVKYTFNDDISSFVYKTPNPLDIEEWQDSAIAQNIINLNLISLPQKVELYYGDYAYPFLDLAQLPYDRSISLFDLDTKDPRHRIWTYSGYSTQDLTESDNYQIKNIPHCPLWRKYSNIKSEAVIKFPKISYRVAQMILPELYKNIEAKESEEAKDFWYEFLKTNQSLVLTEGAKKAFALVSYGIPAISIEGICAAYEIKKDKDGREYLDLNKKIKNIFNWGKRKYYLSFDNDMADQKSDNVFSSELYLAKLFKSHNQDLEIIFIDDPDFKGADDYILQYGPGAYRDLIAKALSVKDFKKRFEPEDFQKKFEAFQRGEDFSWCFNESHFPVIKDEIEKGTIGICPKKICNNFNESDKAFQAEIAVMDFAGQPSYAYEKPLPKHVEVWKESSISEDLINLNLISVPDLVLNHNGNYLAYPVYDLMKVNTDAVLDHFKIAKNKSTRDIWSYAGYKVDGISPIENYEFRLHEPVREHQEYEQLSSKATVILPKVSNRVARQIFPKKYKGLTDADLNFEAKDFWLQVFKSKKDVYLTEGHKKALSLLSHGLIALSIHQSCLGIELDGNGQLSINDDLENFLQRKHGSYFIVFDYEKDPYLDKLVQASSVFIAEQIERIGHKVRILKLPESDYKGVDDYIYFYGFEKFKKDVLYHAYKIKELKSQLKSTLKKLFEQYQKNGEPYPWCFKPCKAKCINTEIEK